MLSGDADDNQIDLSLEDEEKEKTSSETPILSNKNSMSMGDSMINITAPAASEASAITSSSAHGETQDQLLGFSIPTFCLKDAEGSAPLLDNTYGRDDCHIFEEDNKI